MVAEKSAFTRGWERAKARYPDPPKTKAVCHFGPPRDLNEIEQESFIDGYLAWCSGRYQDRARIKR